MNKDHTAEIDAVAEALHRQHVDEFDFMKGNEWSDPVPAADCGNCQRWARYAVAARVIAPEAGRATLRALALILALTTACAGLFLAVGSAQAAHSRSPMTGTATVAGKLCQDRGVSNYYVHHWQHLPAWKILNSRMRFHAHMCRANGFRLYKSNADTAQEANFARRFLRAVPPKGDRQWGYKASIYCRTSATSAYFLDLQFYWTSNLHHLDLAERHHYDQWSRNYAAAHGCQLFAPKGA